MLINITPQPRNKFLLQLFEWLYTFLYRNVIAMAEYEVVYVPADVWPLLMDTFAQNYGDLVSDINRQIRREWSKHYVTTNTTSPR